ncbi:hypothetical protein E4U41_003397 [Claviceps citrina]|nr:hypothetical protein E4U41_003397 [Claviceps citrina]
MGKWFSLPSQRAFTQTYPANCQRDMMHPDFPTTVQDIIDRKLPQLILHIFAFANATIVTISMPANMLDNASFKSLLENWSFVLAGREERVALVFGPHKDALEELVCRAEETHVLERVKVPSQGFSRCTLPDWLRRRNDPVMQRRMVYMPKVVYDELLGQVRRDIARILEEEEQRPIVSDADILLAWMSKLQGGAGTKPRAVTTRNMFNLRRRLSPLRDPSREHLQMLTLPICSTLSARDLRQSIGHVALHHKRVTDTQTSEYQLLALAKSVLGMKKTGKDPLRNGAAAGAGAGAGAVTALDYCNMTWLHLLSAADFGPAVLASGGEPDGPRYNPPGTMTSAYALETGKRPADAVCQVVGRDSEGHVWMYCQLEPDVWVRLEEELYRLQKGINSPVSGHSLRFESTRGR